ncbi:hypothetical protein CCS01_31590 [Rhodopila globiformis]|uniref:Phospholipase D n=1 Tax=Rhodopila globiformis TaxID=1071 RepID=A0A2S6MU71_RHOGL|nr:hypothetical protein CCS01_31590 [Rhodopila globiformis]
MRRRQAATLAAATVLSRCTAVPHITGLTGHDVALPGHRQPRDPGPLDESAALLEEFNLQRALSAAPIVIGNKVTLLPGGAQAFAAMFQALGAAKDSINLEYFILADIESGGVHLSEILLDRLNAGVRMNIIYDSYGSRNTPAAFFDSLKRAGAKMLDFHPIDPLKAGLKWAPNDRDHRKIMVVDGRVGFTGGINLDKAYENPPSAGIPPDGNTAHAYWLDTAVRIEGPAVAELQKLFFGTWQEQKAPAPDPADYFPSLPRMGVQTIRIIGSSPGDKEPLYYASLLTAIKNARRRVWLCSGYFVPPHQEREDLYQTARAGIDVRIVVPAFSDVEAAVYAARAAYGDLLESGARIYEVHDAVVHAKLAVVDDTWTVVGSSNLDRRSVIFNQEVDAVILGHDTAAQVEALLRQYMTMARPVTLDRWRRRSITERVRELEARIWQYWM